MSEGKGQRVELGRKTKKYCQEFNEFLLNTSRISITYRPRWWELERSSRERNTHGAGPQYKNVGPVGGEEERSRNRQWSTRGAIDTGVRFIPSAGHFQDCAYSIEYGSLSRQLFQAPCFGHAEGHWVWLGHWTHTMLCQSWRTVAAIHLCWRPQMIVMVPGKWFWKLTPAQHYGGHSYSKNIKMRTSTHVTIPVGFGIQWIRDLTEGQLSAIDRQRNICTFATTFMRPGSSWR